MATFSWAAPAADVALGALGGISRYVSDSARDRVAEANARARNKVRTAQNLKKSGELSLAATVRSINNQRILEQAGRSMDAAVTNAIRTADSFTRGNFEATIRDAEMYGAAASQAAASGIGGASIQAIGAQVAMRASRAQQDREARQGEVTYDQLRSMAGIMPEAASRLDISPLTLGLDHTVSTAQPQADLMGSLLTGLLSKKDSLQLLLGSGVENTTASAASTGATAYPVADRSVQGVDLPPAALFRWDAAGAQSLGLDNTGMPVAPISIT